MAARKPAPEAIARTVKARLRALADPVKARGAERYFKETVKCYGVASADVRALEAEVYGLVRAAWTYADAVALCDILFAADELEAKGVAGLVLARFKASYPPAFFAKVKGWLAAGRLANWASVDVFCTDAVAAFLERYPAYVERIKAWAFHPNRWVKRAALVSFIRHARRGRFLDAIYGISASVFPVDDDLIHKANGWLLREAGKADAARLERFLRERGPEMPRTTVRYAIERFPAAKRKALLAATRPSGPA